MSIEKGVLYVVATPIGNLADMSPRAVEVLKQVDRIACEDTRHSRPLLRHFGIATPMLALHEHNEAERVAHLLERLTNGESIALISDAGTPLISDPGFRIVRAVHEQGLRVVPIPGPAALIAALSAAGMPTDRFVFEGFLPARHAARVARLEHLRDEPRTLLFYESSHRVVETLADLAQVFGATRPATLARELTKHFETIRSAELGALSAWVQADADQQKGEFVLVVHGAAEAPAANEQEAQRVLDVLLEELPVKKAAALAARITGMTKNRLYDMALAKKGK